MSYLFLAGINNSSAQHWQRRWHLQMGGIWVEHRDWDRPNAEEWIQDLKKALKASQGPTLIIAHSLGCLLLAAWARERKETNLAAAFLVAPPNPESTKLPPEIRGFGSPFESRLEVPILLVASQNDPFGDLEYAKRLSGHWNAEFLDVGAKGHINVASGLGDWEEGRRAMNDWIEGRDLKI
jgi:predicted alpha/beta hydrolase family esterase